MSTYPTQAEITQAANVISRLPKGRLPFEIFRTIAEKTVLPCIELSLFHQNNGATEVLLTQREPDDYYWPSAWHLPGGVLIATDEKGTFSSIFERTLIGELNGEQKLLFEPQLGLTRFHESGRGRELVLEYYSEVKFEDNFTKGKFFDVENLPEGTLQQYYEILPRVVDAFKGYTGLKKE